MFHQVKCGGGCPAKYIMTTEQYRDKLIHNKDNFDLSKLNSNKEMELKRVLKDFGR